MLLAYQVYTTRGGLPPKCGKDEGTRNVLLACLPACLGHIGVEPARKTLLVPTDGRAAAAVIEVTLPHFYLESRLNTGGSRATLLSLTRSDPTHLTLNTEILYQCERLFENCVTLSSRDVLRALS